MRQDLGTRESDLTPSSSVKLNQTNTGAALSDALEGKEMPIAFAVYDNNAKATITATMKLDVSVLSGAYTLADKYYATLCQKTNVTGNKAKELILRTQAITTAMREMFGSPCRDSASVQDYFQQNPHASLSQTFLDGKAQCPCYGWLGAAYLQHSGFETTAIAGYENEYHAFSVIHVDGKYYRICTTNPLSFDAETQSYQPNIVRLTPGAGKAMTQAQTGMSHGNAIGLEEGNIVELDYRTQVGIAAAA